MRIVSAAFLAFAASLAAADEVTVPVTVKVDGVSWAVSWGKALAKAFESLDGISSVKALDKVTFELRFKEDAKATPSAVKAKLPKKYSINTFSIELGGDLAVSDKENEKGLWLVSKSGQKYLLANRKPADENDKPEDLVAKLQSAHDAGDRKASVKGKVTENEDGVATLSLEKAEVVKEEGK